MSGATTEGTRRAASAGSERPQRLPYEAVPQQLALETTATGLHASIPITRRARRVYVRASMWRACHAFGPLMVLMPFQQVIGHNLFNPAQHVAHPMLVAALISAVAIPVVLGLLALALLEYASTLRPFTIELGTDRLTVTRLHRRPLWVARPTIASVRVEPMCRSGFGRLRVSKRYDPLYDIGPAAVAELEPIAAALRAALNLPDPPEVAAAQVPRSAWRRRVSGQ